MARCSLGGVLRLHLLLSHSSTSSGPKTLSPLAPRWPPKRQEAKVRLFGVIWTLICHLSRCSETLKLRNGPLKITRGNKGFLQNRAHHAQ